MCFFAQMRMHTRARTRQLKKPLFSWVFSFLYTGDQRYEAFKCRVLQGKSVPHYAAIEPNGDGLMIVSYKPFKFLQDEESQPEENEDGKIGDKKKGNICSSDVFSELYN